MKILERNSTGPLVSYLQSLLARLGFYLAPIDGIFGTTTEQAVKDFQKAFGLSSDGIVGPSTWNALYPYINGYTSYVIQSGDTLYTLANQFNTSIQAILYSNPNLSATNLPIGKRIRIPFGDIVPTNIPYSSEILEMNITSLQNLYPFLNITSIGESVLGKPLYCIEIGNGEKELFYNSAIHANEWITAPLLMKFTENFCKAYVEDTSLFGYSARELFNTVHLYIVPMINPDGIDLVTGQLTQENVMYQYAQNIASSFPTIPFPSGWKANINGVDLNLQFPAGWENAKEIKFSQGYTKPAPRDYVGLAPISQPESIALYRFTLAHDFRLILTYHTQGEVIYWRFLDYLPPNSLEIGEQFAFVSGYELESTPYGSGFAGYKDWFIQTYNRPRLHH